MRWTEEQTVTFVKIYLQHEYLWNTKHDQYGNKYLRKKAYKDISTFFKEATGIKLIEREVMTKIKNLSSTYVQELAKIKKSSESDQPYKSTMKWFHYWYRCKHNNQPVSPDSQISFDDQKMWLDLSEDERDSSVLPKSGKNEINTSSSHPRKWNEDETLKFTKLYLQNDNLWNPKHGFFRNREAREEAYSKISLEFETATGIALTESEVLLKIKSLKSTYWQLVKKIKKFSTFDLTYVPKQKWFAVWDRCYNARYSNEETEPGVSNSDDLKLCLQLSNDEDEDTEPTQSKSEETTTRNRWSEADTLKFVKIYLQYEFLYNPRHKYFRQNKLRHEGYNSVISEFETATGIKLDEKELKTKIKCLGSTYAQELAKIKRGSETNKPYSPTIKWFKHWHKHKYSMQQRNARNPDNDTQEPAEDSPVSTSEEDEQKLEDEEQKLEEEDEEHKIEEEGEEHKLEDEEEHKFEVSTHSDSESECEVKKRKIEKSENQDNSDKFSFNFVDANSDSLWKEDEFEHYGKYIASVLRRMGLEKALQIQLEIQNLLSVARKG